LLCEILHYRIFLYSLYSDWRINTFNDHYKMTHTPQIVPQHTHPVLLQDLVHVPRFDTLEWSIFPSSLKPETSLHSLADR